MAGSRTISNGSKQRVWRAAVSMLLTMAFLGTSVSVVAPPVVSAVTPNEEAVADGIIKVLDALSGLDSLEDLADALPLTNLAPLGPTGLNPDAVWTEIKSAVTGLGDKSANAVQSALNNLDGSVIGGATLSIDTTVTPDGVTFKKLALARSLTTPLAFLSGDPNDPATFNLDGGTLNVVLGLTVADQSSAVGALVLQREGITVQIPAAGVPTGTFSASVSLQGGSVGARLGMLDVTATGSVAVAVNATITLRDPDSDGVITQLEIVNAAPSDLFELGFGGTAAMNLSLSAGLDGLGAVTGTIELDDTDITDGLDTPIVTLGGLRDFTRMTPQDVLASIAQLAVSLRALQLNLGNINLPFIDENLAELGSWNERIQHFFVVNGLATNPENPLDFTVDAATLKANGLDTLEGIIDELARSVLDNGLATAEDLGLVYDPPTNSVLFSIVLDDVGLSAPPGATLNVAEELAKAGIGALQVSGSASITFTPRYSLKLTVGLDLSDLGVATPVTDRVFFQPEPGNELEFDAPVAANLDLAGRIGMLQVKLADTVDGTVPLLAKRDGDSRPMLSVDVSTTNPNGRVTLGELFASLSSAGVVASGDSVTVTAGPLTIAGTLNVAVPPTTLKVDGKVGSTTLASASLTFSWPDLTAPGGIQVSADPTFNDDFLSFNIDPSDPFALFATILEGINAALQAYEDLTGDEVNARIPLLDLSLTDLMKFIDNVQDAVNALASDPAGTLQLLELAVEAAILKGLDKLDGITNFTIPAIPDPSSYVDGLTQDFDIDQYREDVGKYLEDLEKYLLETAQVNFVNLRYEPGNSPGALVFELNLGVCGTKSAANVAAGCSFAYPLTKEFNLDLSKIPGADFGGIVGADATGTLELDYVVAARVHVGVELPTVTPAGPGQLLPQVSGLPKLFLAGTSGITASVAGSIVAEFGASIGPFGVRAGDLEEKAETGADCNNDIDDDHDDVVNDGCPQEGPLAETGDQCLNDTDDDPDPDTNAFDGKVNDGCPAAANPASARAGAMFTLAPADTSVRYYLNPGAGQSSLGDFFGGITPSITKAPSVDCPGDATPGVADFICARLPIYLEVGGTDELLGTLRLTVPDFNDFSTATLTGDDEILNNLKAKAEKLLWSLIGQGIKKFGEAVDQAMSAASYDVEVPIIGDLLDAGADIAGEFKDRITDPIGDLVSSLDTASDFGAIKSAIQNFFWSKLGPNYLINWYDPDDNPVDVNDPATIDDIKVDILCGNPAAACDGDAGDTLLDIVDVRVQMAIGQLAAATIPDFDWGVPGLSLRGNGTLTGTVKWQVNLGFGLSLDDGFYLLSDPAPSASSGGKDIAVSAQVHFGERTTALTPDKMALEGDLAFLSAALWNTKDAGNAAPEVDLTLGIDLPNGPGGKLGLAQLTTLLNPTEWNVGISGGIDLQVTLATTVAVQGGASGGAIPRLLADLYLDWSFSGSIKNGLSSSGLNAGFDDVRLDLGSLVKEFLQPVLGEVQKYTKPLQPIIDTLKAPIPGVSQLAELVGAAPVTLIDLMEAVSGADLTMVRRLLDVITFANSIPAGLNPGDPSLIIPIGDFLLDSAALTKPELPPNVKDKLIQGAGNVADAAKNGGVFTQLADAPGSTSTFNQQVQKARSTDGGFSFPAFQDPSQLFQLLVGKDVSLVEFDAGTLKAGVSWSQSFGPITIGPIPVSIVVSISASVEGRFVIGYDTKGIRQLVKAFSDGNPGFFDSIGMLLAGVYLSDVDKDGKDVPEIRLVLEGAVGAAVDLVIVKAGVEAGIRATLDMNLHDGGFGEPVPPENLDGKLRIDEIISFINNPICLFDVSGRLEAFIRIFVTIDLFLFSATFKQTIVNIVLLELDNITAELCKPPPPVLATPVGDGVLRLNMGRQAFRNVRNYATGETEEKFTVRQITETKPDGTASVSVSAFGLVQEFHNVTKVVGEGDAGKDSIIAEAGGVSGVCQANGTVEPNGDIVGGCNSDTQEGKTITKVITFTLPVAFCGGAGADVLGGGDGDDLLVGHGALTADMKSCTTGAPGDGPDDADKISGQGGDDTIHGNGGDDDLNGGSGNDTIYGGNGDDEIVGGPGADELHGGEGHDNMLGGPEPDPCPGSETDICSTAADDLMYGGPGNDTMEGDHGKDTMYGGSGNDVMVGGLGNDTMYGDEDDDLMFGNEGNDTMHGGDGDDDMFGGTGNDTMYGDGGHDDMIGEQGTDTIRGGDGQDIILGDRGIINRDPGGGFNPSPSNKPLVELIATPDAHAGGDFLHGEGDDDRIWGQEGNDIITGGAGDDILRGNAGDDHMSGNGGADEMYGDAGNDIMYGDAAAGLTVGAADGIDTIRGGDGNDTISGNAAGDKLYGDAGNDTIYGDATTEVCAFDGEDVIFGGPGDDYLLGNAAGDTIYGEGGNDRIVGGSDSFGECDGSDLLIGGVGDDVIVGDNGTIGAGVDVNDKLVTLHLDGEGDGDDIFGGDGRDRIYGHVGDDVIDAGAGNDVVEGNEGDDTIDGGPGDDDLVGGSSSNTGIINADRVGNGRPDGGDIISGGAGDDWIAGDNALINRNFPAAGRAPIHLFDVGVVGSPAAAGTSGNDTISGGDGTERIFGQGGNDILYGDAGHDYIEGNDGDDSIFGGDGDDDLIGGGSANDGRILPNRVGDGLLDVGETIISGGAGEDWMAGDNALIDRNIPSGAPAPIILFDVETVGSGAKPGTGGGEKLMTGGDGEDWMFGQTGNDVMHGDAGNDYIEGNNGDDTIYGGDGDDDLVGGGSANDGVIDGDRVGNGLLDTGEALISGGNGEDWITGDNALVNRNRPIPAIFQRAPIELFDVQTAAGPPISPLVSGGDLLHGDDGNDRIYGQGNGAQPADQTDPADGRNNDFVGSVEGSFDFLRVGGPDEGIDEDAAGWFGDIILGGLGDDEIEGNHGNDLIFGNGTAESGPDQDDILGGGSADDGKIWPSSRLNFGANLLDGHDTIHGDSGEADAGDGDVILGDNGWIQRPGGSQVGPGPGPATADELAAEANLVDLVNRLVLMTKVSTPVGTYGNDYLAGNGGHDEIYGQGGHDAILGEWGSDALVGDLGQVSTDLLGSGADTLCGAPRFLKPKEPFVGEHICQHGTLFRLVELYAFDETKPASVVIGHDVMLGGDGDDWMHGGAGQDLMQGDGDGGGEIPDPNAPYTWTVEDPNPLTADADKLFGGDSNLRGTVHPVTGGDGDAMWGGRGNDYLFGGNGDDMLDVRPDANYPVIWSAWAAADVESYHGQDVGYGGYDQDALQANMAANGPVPGDRMLDWAGVYNITYLCPATYGAYVTIRDQSPGLIDWVLELAIASGALNPKTAGTSGHNEVAMVYKPDVKNNNNPIYPGTPGHFTCSPSP